MSMSRTLVLVSSMWPLACGGSDSAGPPGAGADSGTEREAAARPPPVDDAGTDAALDPVSDAALPEDASIDVNDAATACNALDDGVAPVASTTQLAQAAPAPKGGTIADGLYVLTSVNTYTGVGGATGK